MATEVTELKRRATMINDKVRMYLLPPLINAAVRAGASIMNVYKNLDDYDISLKDDKTPITLADRLAHKTIREYLGPTRIPILSEEGREMLYDERRNWELYWLVDPLDGTVEFIKGNNEFTVNIALMENNVCMGAVIYVPYFEKLYIAGRDAGSYVKEHVAPDSGAEYTYDEIVTGWTRLPLECEAVRPHPRLRVAVSRSHQTPETAEHIARLRATHPDLEIVEQGSSYKFCLLAEGRVDYYVRTTHTYEWDTAAGELILAEAGGRTRTLPDDGVLRYNEKDLRNPWFVCRSKYCVIYNGSGDGAAGNSDTAERRAGNPVRHDALPKSARHNGAYRYEKEERHSSFFVVCSMSHAEQLPEQPASAQSVCPESSRDSCTAHRMPSRCMFLLVDISESIWCPLIISVSDMPTTKRATAPRAKRKTINHVGITVRYFYVLKFWLSVTNVYICKINCKNVARTFRATYCAD